MALKKQQDMLATFSMASMTDVIFLLLVFFLVTSTFVFPTAMDVDLPEGVEQSPEKPATRVYVDSAANYYVQYGDLPLTPVRQDSLAIQLEAARQQDSISGIAVYADNRVPYGKVVEVLNIGARHGLKMVLATKPGASDGVQPGDVAPEQTAAPATQVN